MQKNITIALIFISTLTACTLYKSGGREAIEKNEGGIILLATGTEAEYEYTCRTSKYEPDFLKKPLVVKATPYESPNFSTFYDDSTRTVLVYQFDEARYTNDYCEITFFNSDPITDKQLLDATKMSFEIFAQKQQKLR